VRDEDAPQRDETHAPHGATSVKKKLALALACGATIFGGVYGLAASLSLTSDSLGAGQSVVAACQSTAMRATYLSSYSATTPGYNTTTVRITGLTSTCYSKAYSVTVADGSNVSVAEASGTTPSTGSSFDVTLTNDSAAIIGGVAMVISG
jgi:hypothetical protein